MIEQIKYIIPELILSLSALLLLMYGVFSKCDSKSKCISKILILISFAVLYLLIACSNKISSANAIFLDSFTPDSFANLMKIIVTILFIFSLVIFNNDKFFSGSKIFEFPILSTLSCIGAFLLISANDLIIMYLGLELMSLSSYVMVAINRDSTSATEAGVKYFVLGAVASCLILFGSSMIYGFLGSTNLTDIAIEFTLATKISDLPLASVIGLVIVLSGFFFKISAVPMHMWAPDVYEGSSKSVLAIISTIPKIASIAFLIRLVTLLGDDIFPAFSLIIAFSAVLSMLLGAFAGLKQNDIRRLLAYSSIANIGFVLAVLSVGGAGASIAAVIYITIYTISSIGVIAIFTSLQKEGEDLTKISDLSGLSKTAPISAIILSSLMFSLAGIPPLAGFWAKFYVFVSAVEAENYFIILFAIFASVVACFYYLRIVKIIYFDEISEAKISTSENISLKLVIGFICLFVISLCIYISKFKAIISQYIVFDYL